MSATDEMRTLLYQYSLNHLWSGIGKGDKIKIDLNELTLYPENECIMHSSEVIHKLPDQSHSYRLFWFSKEALNQAGVYLNYEFLHDLFDMEPLMDSDPTNDPLVYDESRMYYNESWISSLNLLERGYNAYIFDTTGPNPSWRVIPKKYIFFHVLFNDVAVAIRTDVLQRFFGKSVDLSFNMILENNTDESVKIIYKYIGNSNDKNSVIETITRFEPSLVLRNGKPFFPDNIALSDLSIGDDIEFHKYMDIVYSATIDPLNDTFVTNGGLNSQLVHIPKSENLENKLIPVELCELYMYEKTNRKNAMWIDRFFHEPSKIFQITHSDFGVPEDLLNYYLSYLDGSLTLNDVECELIFRDRFKDKYLADDISYIRYLYLHTDSEIKDILLGNIGTAPSVWNAADLTDSRFTTEINDVPGRLKYQEMELSDYISVYGFYNTANIICPKVNTFYVDENSQHVFAVNIPVMFNEQYTKAHMFLNGLKISDEFITRKELMYHHPVDKEYAAQFRIESGHRLVIYIDESVDFTPPNEEYSELIVELYEDPDKETQTFIDPAAGTEINFDSDVYKLYKETDVSATDDEALIDVTFDKRYEDIDPASVGSFTDDKFTFDGTPGKYILQSKVNVFKLIETFENHIPETQDPDTSEEFDPIVINIDDDQGYPVIGVNTSEVFLNGRMLVKDVDYHIIEQYDEGHFVHSQIIIQNVEYVQETNLLEIYVSCSGKSDENYGYAQPEKIFGLLDHYKWLSNLSIYSNYGHISPSYFLPVWSPASDGYSEFMSDWFELEGDHPKGSSILNLHNTDGIFTGCLLDRYVNGIIANTFVTNIDHNNKTITISHPLTVDIQNGTQINIKLPWIPDTGRLSAGKLTVPYLLYNYMNNLAVSGTTASDDDTVRENIYTYFSDLYANQENVLFVPNSHKVYSLLVNYIVREMLRGNITIDQSYSQDDLNSLIDSYLWVANHDLVFSKLDSTDKRFVDVYPSYARYLADNRNLYQFTQDLIRHYENQISDDITTGDIVPDKHEV